MKPSSLSPDSTAGLPAGDGFSVFPSPLGPVAVAFNSQGVSAVDIYDDGFLTRFEGRFARSASEAEPPADWVDLINQALEVGQPLALPIDFRSVTAFGKQVLLETASIPRGQTRSYGWLAQKVGRPQAARGVGRVMAGNPVPLVIPCHRVVRSDGHIGHYGLGGESQKRRLLQMEQAVD